MNWEYMAFAALLAVLIWGMLSIVYWSVKNGISPMPSSRTVLEIVKREVKPCLKPGQVIYELGAGWGTAAFFLAHVFPQVRVIAFETATWPYLFCRLRAILRRPANLEIVRRDIHSVDPTEADWIYCYLYPQAMEDLASRLEQALEGGSRLVSNTFALPGVAPEKVIELDDIYRTKIYFY